MFSFSINDGWTEITDFLQSEEAKTCDEELSLAGFSPHPGLSVGKTDENSFCVSVYRREMHSKEEPHDYQFIVGIDIGGFDYYVATPKLPDLLELLRQVVPLSIKIDEWSINKEKFYE